MLRNRLNGLENAINVHSRACCTVRCFLLKVKFDVGFVSVHAQQPIIDNVIKMNG